MLQAGATSEFPRSAAGVVALQSAGEYDSKEIRDGIAYLRQFGQGLRRRPAEQPLFLRPVLCGPGDVDRGRRSLGGMVPGHSQRAARSPVGVGLLARHRRLQRIRNGHGADHPPDTQRLLAHLSTLSGRAVSVLLLSSTKRAPLRRRGLLAVGMLGLAGPGLGVARLGRLGRRGGFVRSGLQGALDRWPHGLGTDRLAGPGCDQAGVRRGTAARAAARPSGQADSRVPAARCRRSTRSHVMLPDGDCLMRVVIGSSTETSLEVQSDALGKLAVPLDGILGLIFAGRARPTELDALWEQVRARTAHDRSRLADQRRPARRRVPRHGREQDQDPGGRQARRSRSAGGRRARFRPGAGQLSSAQVRLPRADAEGRLAAGCHRGPARRG